MSLATFKKKSLTGTSRGKKLSGKATTETWLYQGPYGTKGNLASTIFNGSLVGPSAGFSVTGSNRNIGGVGASMRFSKSATPYRGQYPKGWGGSNGRYPSGKNEVVLNIKPVQTGVAIQNTTVNPPVLSTRGMLARRFRWINSGQYPNNWVQPMLTGNQTDSSSQGLYIQQKSAANYIWNDVNEPGKYVKYYNTCVSGCQSNSARGYTINNRKSNAVYTKTLYQSKDASEYTLKVQRKCHVPVGLQKPFPYAVQTGTGILRGGITVNNVASTCNMVKPEMSPPDWYTEASNSSGVPQTKKDQLQAANC